MITEKAKEITNWVYQNYGSDTGYLFGITPDRRAAVEGVVQATLDYLEEERLNA